MNTRPVSYVKLGWRYYQKSMQGTLRTVTVFDNRFPEGSRNSFYARDDYGHTFVVYQDELYESYTPSYTLSHNSSDAFYGTAYDRVQYAEKQIRRMGQIASSIPTPTPVRIYKELDSSLFEVKIPILKQTD